jgi:putative transposase
VWPDNVHETGVSLERVVRVYAAHYNAHRPHRGLQLEAPERSDGARPENRGARLVRRDVLGGLIHEYEAAA